MTTMQELKGKYIWIVGASSGIGAACARHFAAEGAILALSGRRADRLEELRASLPGTAHMALPCDVTDHATLAAACGQIMERWGRLDSVVFMAAQYTADHVQQRVLATVQQTLSVNLGGMFNLIDIVRPLFEKQGFGQIALTASVAGYRGLPYGQPYSCTKAAILNYAESLKIELEPHGIDVKAICPGFVATDLTAQNEFIMPLMISADEAAVAITKGITSRAFEIHFPKAMTWIMKLVDALPRPAYFALARIMREQVLRKQKG